jgi:hypothetical protein
VAFEELVPTSVSMTTLLYGFFLGTALITTPYFLGRVFSFFRDLIDRM